MAEPSHVRFPHAMLREIYEQPQALARTLSIYFDGTGFHPGDQSLLAGTPVIHPADEDLSAGTPVLRPEIAARLTAWSNPAGEILIAASGSSRHSGLYGEILLEDLCGLAVDVEYASEYSCHGGPNHVDPRHPSVLVLSQSGETTDTLGALEEARRQGHRTLAITNAAASTMATEADVSLALAAGEEKAIPATKSFLCQLAVLYVLALYEGARLGRMNSSAIAAHIAGLRALPERLGLWLDRWREQAAALARSYRTAATFLYLGRGIHYAIAREGALKLKECCYVHAEGYPAGELKHGPNALVGERVPLVVLATVDRASSASVLRYEKTLQLLREVREQGARVIALALEGDAEVPKLASDCIPIPAACEYLLPLLEVVPLQLFAYSMALEHGVDVDRPRNLSKAVVEKTLRPTRPATHGVD